MNEKNRFSIPWWVIIVALCVAAPVGVILILLKVFFESDGRNSSRAGENIFSAASSTVKTGRSAASEIAGKHAESTTVSKKRKQKHPSKVLHVIAVIHFALAALLLCVAVGDGITGNVTAILESIGPALYFVLAGAACVIASTVLRRREQDTSR